MKKSILSFALILTFFAFSGVSAQTSAPDTNSLKSDFNDRSNPLIKKYLHYYQGRGRFTMETGLARSGRFSIIVRRIFREENIPEDLIWIAQVLSLWNSERGLWLFNQSVTKKYELRKNKYLDERKDFEKATRITARYLKYLSGKYSENQELTIAAYYIGETTVNLAIKRAKVKNFWLIYPFLPHKTRNFVPKVLATILIANNREFYKFEKVQIDSPIFYDLVRIPPSIRLGMIAEFLDSNFRIIKYLNPELISTSTPDETYIIRIPSGKSDIFVERIRRYLQNKTMQTP